MNFVPDPMERVIQVAWPLEGAFVMSLLGAHVIGAMLHSNPSHHFHLELAFTGVLVKKVTRGLHKFFVGEEMFFFVFFLWDELLFLQFHR